MIVHVYDDGSEGYQYELGDRVIVPPKKGDEGLMSSYWNSVAKADACTVAKIDKRRGETWRTAMVHIHHSDNWGNLEAWPWMVQPHPETLAKASRIKGA